MKSALVVVDLQEDFLPSDGSLAVKEGRDIISPICDLLDLSKYNWSTIIATQDWHPHDHISFASQHGVPPFTEIEFKHPLGHKQDGETITFTTPVWPDHCVQNTFGSSIDALFIAKFNQLDDQIPKSIIRKGYLKDREYYSCFKDIWKLHKTEIEDELTKLGVTDVVFVGIAYDFCVMHSAIDCKNAGFNSYVVKSLCKSVVPENDDKTDLSYTEKGVKVLQSVDEYKF